MAGISIGHLMHTDRPLTWRSQPSCPRCTLPFTSNTPDELVHRVAYLLDCQHLLCGQCVQENAQERCITCNICKHRMDIPEDCENPTQALHPSLFVLGVMQQLGYEMANVTAYWQGDEEGSVPESDYPKCSTTAKLSHSDVDKPKKLLSLLEKAYNTYEKSKKQLEKQAKIQQENVGSVVEKINAHFVACHNALQIEEHRVLQEARNAYIKRYQSNKKDQRQLKKTKECLQGYIKQAKLFSNESEKQTKSDSDASWKQFRRDVKTFLESQPIKLEGDGKKMLRPPIHYQPRETFLKDIQACHSLQIDAVRDAESLVPITHTEAKKVHESANASQSSSSKHREEHRKPRERSKESSSSSLKHKEERRARELSKEHSPSKRKEERKTGDKAKEPSKSHRSRETEKKDHKRSQEPTGEGSAGVECSWWGGKSEPGSSESQESKPAPTAWQKALDRMKARAKGREKTPELAARSDRDRASTSICDRLNLTQSSSRPESEARDGEAKWRTVNVTHIVSPREFYVQDELFDGDGASSMSELCNTDAQAYEPVLITGSAPITITPGTMYLVRAEGFGELAWNNRWYRAEVHAVDYPKRGQYRVQYVDYGMYDTVEREQIRPLSAEVASIARIATRCALYRLQPGQGAQQWTDECHQVMKDFIDGRPMWMYEMSTFSDGALLVDLFLPPVPVPGKTRGKEQPGRRWEGRYAPMSLRAALIYLMVAEDANEFPQDGDALKGLLRKRTWQQQRWLKDASGWTLRHADIPHAPVLQEHDHFDCTITHAKSIEQFHIMPNEWKTTMLEPLQRQLDTVCQTASRVYCPYVGLVCAFVSHDKDGVESWLRGRVIRVLRARCLLLALDTGELFETPWTDMRLLAPDDPALYRHPLAVRCSLGHIRPRRADPGAHWSKAAVTEFLQIACSRALRFTVSMGQLEQLQHGNSYSVLLYLVNKSDRDTCVNGLLVRNGHAECIGLEENVQDRIRELAPGEFAVQEQEPSEPKPTTAADVAVVRVADPRMSVQMLRVVSPGEFYVLLCEQQCAFEQMHKLLQDHMDDRIDEEEEEEEEDEDEGDGTTEGEEAGDGSEKKKEGKRKAPGDVCVVFARVNEGDPCEWHRARIETVLDDGVHYEAFLIDRAVTTKVHRTNVARLTARMAQIQPVAFRCRLACLSPVGGSTVWHQSSLDAFRNLIASYAQHAISLDAKPKPNEPDQALPVVLWGVRIEDWEALAPRRTVYYNLNQALAKLGLAHLSGRFRTFATSGSEAVEEHQLLEDAIRAQLRAEMEQFFRTVAAVNDREQTGTQGGGGGGEGGGEDGEDGGRAVRDGIKTAETVLNEQEHEWMDSQCRKALGQVGSAEGGKPVHAWLPAAPLEKTIFVGVPTYVGSDGSVFLHDVVHEPLLERIRSVIQKHVASNPDGRGTRFAVGKACLARFHLDGQFYRATVKQELGDDRYLVTFVDYGNVEECTCTDLLPAAVCGAVPVQALQVRLSGVTPKEGKECKHKREKKHKQQPHTGPRKWPEAALDACHALIVQKRCSIRVDPNDEGPRSGSSYGTPSVPYCTLQLLEVTDGARVDVTDVLLELGLFERGRNRRVSVSSQSSLIPPVTNEPQADVLRRELLYDMLQRSTVSMRLTPTITPADRDLKQWIENIEMQFEAQHAANSTKHEDPNEWNFDDTPDPLNHAQLIDALEPIEPDWQESIEPDWHEPAPGTSGGSERRFRMVTVEIADMSPMPSPATLNSEEFETSSRLSEDGGSIADFEDSGWLVEVEHLEEGRIASPLFRSFPVLPQPERLTRGFFAEFTNYASEQTLYVYPHLEGHTRRMITVAERVQRRALSNNELHRWQASLAEPGAPCLAPYKEDGLYYRAIVESRDEQRREVSVLYVDYLNRETVPLATLRKCPIELQRTTLRNLPVRLAGVRANPRLREEDVVRRLSDLLEKPFFVKLVEQQNNPARRGNASVLPVELYTDADCRTLVYQQMIDEKYFVPVRASEEM
uniref:RING-type domain-containing protein n=1 Tax=Anopheles atroparvus TaxID=41427 RepID=A0AAG5DMW5_ANOAO